MKQILTFGIIIFLLTSCMTTNKYSTFVNSKTKRAEIKNETSRDWLTVKSDKIEPKENMYDQKKNSFVPAILYWKWNSTIECELEMGTRKQYLREGIYKAADSLNLKEVLADNTLEISLKEIPGKFLYENKGNAIIFLIAYTVSGVESISPYPINLEFEYSVNKDGNLEMKGVGYVQNNEQPLRNIWKSTKKFTWLYLDEFKKETERMGTELVSGIIEELKKNVDSH